MTEPNGRGPRPQDAAGTGQFWTDDAMDAAGGLDLLLTDASRGGGQLDSPVMLGDQDHPVRCAAPGTYVHDR